MARSRRLPQEINAGSMADIAFLLLIFFLVTTKMDTDQGIMRQLPPLVEDIEKIQEIKERNIFVVLANSQDRLLVEDEEGDINALKDQVKEFIQNPKNDPNLSERQDTASYIQGIGEYYRSKGVVSLQNDKGTSYGLYIQVQNEVTAAFNELRDELAKEKFGKKFDPEVLTEEQYKAIRNAIPVAISEAEPVNAGRRNK